MKNLILLIAFLVMVGPGLAQDKSKTITKNSNNYLTVDVAKKDKVKSVDPNNTLIREYHFELSLGADKNVIWTDIGQPLPPIFEVYDIEFIGSKAVIEVSCHYNSGSGPAIGTGQIVLNNDATFGTLNFETITKSDQSNYLVIAMVSRPKAITPAGSNALTLDFVKGTLGGLTVQVKIKMYK